MNKNYVHNDTNLGLSDFGIYDTILELGEDKIRSVMKESFGIEFGKVWADNTALVCDDVKGADMEGVEEICIFFSANSKDVGSEVMLSRGLYIGFDCY
jgi:hypothetical protein